MTEPETDGHEPEPTARRVDPLLHPHTSAPVAGPHDSELARPVLLAEYRIVVMLAGGSLIALARDSEADARATGRRLSDTARWYVEGRYVTEWRPLPARPQRKLARRPDDPAGRRQS